MTSQSGSICPRMPWTSATNKNRTNPLEESIGRSLDHECLQDQASFLPRRYIDRCDSRRLSDPKDGCTDQRCGSFWTGFYGGDSLSSGSHPWAWRRGPRIHGSCQGIEMEMGTERDSGSSSVGAAIDIYSHQKTTTATPWSYPPSGGQRRVRRGADDPDTQRQGVDGGDVRRQRQRTRRLGTEESAHQHQAKGDVTDAWTPTMDSGRNRASGRTGWKGTW